VFAGKYDDLKVFTGLVEAMVMVKDREERGVGLQNFSYPPDYDGSSISSKFTALEHCVFYPNIFQLAPNVVTGKYFALSMVNYQDR